jgi:hypothetical protein
VKLSVIKQQFEVEIFAVNNDALNAKGFAVLAGISYSLVREWFHLAGFPAVGGMVFRGDFVLWRRS